MNTNFKELIVGLPLVLYFHSFFIFWYVKQGFFPAPLNQRILLFTSCPMVYNLSYDFGLFKKKIHVCVATDWVVYQAIFGEEEECQKSKRQLWIRFLVLPHILLKKINQHTTSWQPLPVLSQTSPATNLLIWFLYFLQSPITRADLCHYPAFSLIKTLLSKISTYSLSSLSLGSPLQYKTNQNQNFFIKKESYSEVLM